MEPDPIQLNFRRAVPDDAHACLNLRSQTRQNAISEEGLASMGITVQTWAAGIRTDSLPGYVCTDGDSLVGYCFADKASGEIVVVAILPRYEGQGVGRNLLELVVKRLAYAGHRRLFLACNPSPESRSYGFYRHLGWTSTDTFDDAGDELLELFVATHRRHTAAD